jgi:hypothetical protein
MAASALVLTASLDSQSAVATAVVQALPPATLLIAVKDSIKQRWTDSFPRVAGVVALVAYAMGLAGFLLSVQQVECGVILSFDATVTALMVDMIPTSPRRLIPSGIFINPFRRRG